MKALILAAGLGTRLHPLTLELPKCLVPVHGKPILVNALEHLEWSRVDETAVVIGHQGAKIRKAVGKRFGRMPLRFVENPSFAKTGTSYSLWLGLQAMDGDSTLLLEGDVFFERKLLTRFLASGKGTATVGQRYDPALHQGSVVTTGPDGFLNEWAHQDGRRPDFPLQESYKTVNISRLTADFVVPQLSPTLEECLGTRGPRVPLEAVMNRIVRDAGNRIALFDAAGCRWAEIDDTEDLRRAEETFQGERPVVRHR